MLPHLHDYLLDGVVLISGDGSSFGTGFVVERSAKHSFIVTCAHVVEDVQREGAIRASGLAAEVVAFGDPEDIDLAVLRVEGLDVPKVRMARGGHLGLECLIPGYASHYRQTRREELLQGKLINRIVLQRSGGPRVRGWRLGVGSDTPLAKGFSGSPVIPLERDAAFAVATHRESAGAGGYAISLEHLAQCWTDIPRKLIPNSVVRQELAGDELAFLEDLFGDSRINVEALRSRCRETIPTGLPLAPPLGSNGLDLLDWLRERGQQSDGALPLVRVLERLQEGLTDPEVKQRLEWSINHIHSQYGISPPEPVREPPQTRGTPVLLLELWSATPDKSLCTAQGWLFTETGEVSQEYPIHDDQPVDLNNREQLSALVDDFSGVLAERGVDIESVVIEVAVSNDLLGVDVERWSDSGGFPWGAFLPIVLRLRERQRNPKWQLRWEVGWKQLRRRLEEGLDERLWWFEEQQLSQVPARLHEGRCVALSFVPDVDKPLSKNAFLKLLYGGVPAVLWTRSYENLRDFKPGLEKMLGTAALQRLPWIGQNVRARLEADQDTHNPCFHLSILWDDPARRIPKASLRGPA
jgi:hypothetical protein